MNMKQHNSVPVLLGESAPMVALRSAIQRIAPTPLPVLIEGPTGSGKELVAQVIHARSRRNGRMVAFNVCAIADSMFEDALFGHVRGAFTGAATDSRGFLAEADHGTVFLDEISGLSTPNQAKLLRALETGTFRPVGGSADRRSEFRVLSATNESLPAMVHDGRFRADLLFRLRGFVLRVPPLGHRLEDVPALAFHFASLARGHAAISISPRASAYLQNYHWPGNVRELRHAVECAVMLSDSPFLDRHDFEMALDRVGDSPLNSAEPFAARDWLKELLDEHRWDTGRVAEHLGIHRATVYRRMQRLGLAPARKQSASAR